MDTLTRAEAHQWIDDAFTDGTVSDLRAIAAHWDIAGHWNEHVTADEWYTILHEFVQDQGGDDTRSNELQDSDDTGLTAP